MTFSKIISLIFCGKQEIKVERLHMKEIIFICHPFDSFLLVDAIEKAIIGMESKSAID